MSIEIEINAYKTKQNLYFPRKSLKSFEKSFSLPTPFVKESFQYNLTLEEKFFWKLRKSLNIPSKKVNSQ